MTTQSHHNLPVAANLLNREFTATMPNRKWVTDIHRAIQGTFQTAILRTSHPDLDKGLSYYNARWYDAQLGRFVSPDTIAPNPADPQDLNRYTYAGNNPVTRIDPSGHYDFKPGDDPWWKTAMLAQNLQ